MLCVERLNFSFEYKTPEYFVTSQWQKQHRSPSLSFLIYRLVFACYFNLVLALSLITATECNQLAFYAIYLTNWNVMVNAFSSLLGAVLVVLYYQRKIKFSDETNEMSKAFKFYWLLSTVSTVVCISLSCIYWPLIYNGRDKGLNDSLTHAGNAIVLFVDSIFINAHPPRFGHFVYPLGFSAVYSYLFSLPYTVLGGTDRDNNNFIYSVIDWAGNTKGAIVFSLATIIFLTFMHFVLMFLASLRVRFHNYRHNRLAEVQTAQSNDGFDV